MNACHSTFLFPPVGYPRSQEDTGQLQSDLPRVLVQ